MLNGFKKCSCRALSECNPRQPQHMKQLSKTQKVLIHCCICHPNTYFQGALAYLEKGDYNEPLHGKGNDITFNSFTVQLHFYSQKMKIQWLGFVNSADLKHSKFLIGVVVEKRQKFLWVHLFL